jgi:hypothetical protein
MGVVSSTYRKKRTDESNKVGKPNESTTTQKKPMLPMTLSLVSIEVKHCA